MAHLEDIITPWRWYMRGRRAKKSRGMRGQSSRHSVGRRNRALVDFRTYSTSEASAPVRSDGQADCRPGRSDSPFQARAQRHDHAER